MSKKNRIGGNQNRKMKYSKRVLRFTGYYLVCKVIVCIYKKNPLA